MRECLKDCCRNPENEEIYFKLNRQEDWEPIYIYCKICGEILEEY